MSTYWYYKCTNHTPALRSEEFTQHTDDPYFRRGVELANARPFDPYEDWQDNDDVVDKYYESNARRFLIDHPHCRLILISETGGMRTLENPTETFWELPEPQVVVMEGRVRLSGVTLSMGSDSMVLSIETRTKGFDVSMVTGTLGGANNPRAGQGEIEILLELNEHSLRSDESAEVDTTITLTLPQMEGWIFSLDGGGRYGAQLIGVRQSALSSQVVHVAPLAAQA
jgi:hypothetical protein